MSIDREGEGGAENEHRNNNRKQRPRVASHLSVPLLCSGSLASLPTIVLQHRAEVMDLAVVAVHLDRGSEGLLADVAGVDQQALVAALESQRPTW